MGVLEQFEARRMISPTLQPVMPQAVASGAAL